MKRRLKKNRTGAMLDLWRPPHAAGDPIGCLATTYTFSPGLFDEQCLARFLSIESEPDREDLPFLLERETRLGSVYAGVLVDHRNAGVAHSLRWDVLPVRIERAKQHAKLSLLAWSGCVRIIIASANLSEAGYRSNREVAVSIDFLPGDADRSMLQDAIEFLDRLIEFIPGHESDQPEVQRAHAFVQRLDAHTRTWTGKRPRGRVRRQLIVTMPAAGADAEPVSSLEAALEVCRRRAGSPGTVRIASPFFDFDDDFSPVTAALCKLMTRKAARHVEFCVPQVGEAGADTVPRLAAPRALLDTAMRYGAESTVALLPVRDTNGNWRPWHAKMLGLEHGSYTALMIGSSNFTRAGMGVGSIRNAEANLLTVVERVRHGREPARLETVWEETVPVDDPSNAEWLGAQPELEEEEELEAPVMPRGFVAATYRAGDHRSIVLLLKPAGLPDEWSVHACGTQNLLLLEHQAWKASGSRDVVEIEWLPAEPPDRLLVCWEGREAFLALNVEDARALPPPELTQGMSADDMLWILAATDPSAAFRAWARRQKEPGPFDEDVDSAAPADLDPLRRHDLRATFLHRIRHRARILAQLRINLERPVWSLQALEWRLRGFIGIEALGNRLAREIEHADGRGDEALLTLADFLILLREVSYQPDDGCVSAESFTDVYRPFLAELAAALDCRVQENGKGISKEVTSFWNRVVSQCRD